MLKGDKGIGVAHPLLWVSFVFGEHFENSVFEYAFLTFYPNLQDVAKEKYGIYNLIKYVPQENSGWTIIRLAVVGTTKFYCE